jgi:predicted PurR-regulated permease PerM
MLNKRVLTFAIAFSVVALALFILWQVNEVVIYFLLSLILGAIIRPFADYLKVKSHIQAILSIVGLLLILAGLGYLLYLSFMRLSKEVNLLVNTISNLNAGSFRFGWNALGLRARCSSCSPLQVNYSRSPQTMAGKFSCLSFRTFLQT